MKYLFLGFTIILLFLSGCNEEETVTGNVVDNLGDDDLEEREDLEGLSTKEMIEKLTEEAGLEDESDNSEVEENTTEEDVVEETGPRTIDISIYNFKGTPDDVSIKVGDNINWTNNMLNMKHVIVIYLKNDDGTYGKAHINDKVIMLPGESYDFEFSEAGEYKWYSLTKADKIKGIISVS